MSERMERSRTVHASALRVHAHSCSVWHRDRIPSWTKKVCDWMHASAPEVQEFPEVNMAFHFASEIREAKSLDW